MSFAGVSNVTTAGSGQLYENQCYLLIFTQMQQSHQVGTSKEHLNQPKVAAARPDLAPHH